MTTWGNLVWRRIGVFGELHTYLKIDELRYFIVEVCRMVKRFSFEHGSRRQVQLHNLGPTTFPSARCNSYYALCHVSHVSGVVAVAHSELTCLSLSFTTLVTIPVTLSLPLRRR